MTQLQEFECKKCGRCCIGDGVVVLKDDDIDRISAYLNIDKETFLKEYAIAVGNDYWLKDKENKECIFLKNNLCTINPIKPFQCQKFPSKWHSPNTFGLCEGFKSENNKKDET